MKRRLLSFLLVLVLVVSMTLSVSAASPRILSIAIDLSFENNIAHCRLDVSGNQLTDSISATIKLYRGNTCVQTWERSASGFLNFSEYFPAIANAEYTLEAVVTVNGVTEPAVTKTKICK